MVQFEMANGVIAQLWMSYEVPVDSVGELGRYLITGSTGVIDFNAYGDVRVDRGDGKGWVTEWQTPPFQYIADPFTVTRVKGFADQFQDFVDAIAEGREPAVTGADGRAAIAMVEAAERSSRSGRMSAVTRSLVSPVRVGRQAESEVPQQCAVARDRRRAGDPTAVLRGVQTGRTATRSSP